MYSLAKSRTRIPAILQVNKIHQIVNKNLIVYIKKVQNQLKRKVSTKKVNLTKLIVPLQILHQRMTV